MDYRLIMAARKEQLPQAEGHLLLVLATYCQHGRAWPAAKTLASDTGMSIDHIRRLLRSLRRRGLIVAAGVGPKNVVQYKFMLEHRTKKPRREDPRLEKPTLPRREEPTLPRRDDPTKENREDSNEDPPIVPRAKRRALQWLTRLLSDAEQCGMVDKVNADMCLEAGKSEGMRHTRSQWTMLIEEARTLL